MFTFELELVLSDAFFGVVTVEFNPLPPVNEDTNFIKNEGGIEDGSPGGPDGPGAVTLTPGANVFPDGAIDDGGPTKPAGGGPAFGAIPGGAPRAKVGGGGGPTDPIGGIGGGPCVNTMEINTATFILSLNSQSTI